jgi:hypothetical protein
VRTATGRIVIAAVLLVIGLGLRSTATVEQQLANAEQALTTVGPSAALDTLDTIDVGNAFAVRLPVVGALLSNEVNRQQARAAYWLSDYTALPPVGEEGAAAADDSDLVFLSANAGFRSVQRSDLDASGAIQGLDAVLQSYARVLLEEPRRLDAAFNYEFVSLQRMLLAGGGELDAFLEDEAEADPSDMHGAEGAPPPDTAPGEFNVIVPMRPDERGEFEAGAGSVRQRQG